MYDLALLPVFRRAIFVFRDFSNRFAEVDIGNAEKYFLAVMINHLKNNLALFLFFFRHNTQVTSAFDVRQGMDLFDLLRYPVAEMPKYEYACSNCGAELEIRQRISEDALTTCPKCNEESLERLISRSNFSLKGGGWYADGYAGNGDGRSGKARSESGDAASAGASDGASSSGPSGSESSEKKGESKAKSKKAVA